MALELESLRKEIQSYLEHSGIAVFYGYSQMTDTLNQVSWDTEQHPSYKEFIAAARKAGAKLIVFHHQAFSMDQIDDALERLEETDLPREDKRNLESRLRQLQPYEGFTCSVELSFASDGRIYVFELHTEWYEALGDVLAEIEAAAEEEESGDSTLGGYFSNN
ncbi:MAG: hypothetical protein JO211_09535 [Acidobacteriaceae bacterium]|nr:hypothetical protein [Acidobacteriaceae bacterium]